MVRTGSQTKRTRSVEGDPVPAGRQSVSVIIPTHNSADVLGDCLASVEWADEIVVVDMHSTDETEELCHRYPHCRLVRREDYIFGNVNHGMDLAASNWLLRLDSDERLTPELRLELEEFLRDPPAGVTGVECWERPIILGRELHWGFGARHHRKLMFRKGSARYAVQGEHEDLTTSGAWIKSEHGYLHLNYRTVAQYLEKANYYTQRDVERATLPAKPPSAWSGAKQGIRAFYLYFLQKRGYRDGWIGFLDASMRGYYQLVLWAKLRERCEKQSLHA